MWAKRRPLGQGLEYLQRGCADGGGVGAGPRNKTAGDDTDMDKENRNFLGDWLEVVGGHWGRKGRVAVQEMDFLICL